MGLLAEYNIPNVKPKWADFTDAGPGVGVSNNEAKFRDAEFARIHNSDYRVRAHRSRGDSGQNEAERTNSGSGDALVDGETLEWETYKRFEGMSDEEIKKMDVKEFEKYERTRMEKNAWAVAQELQKRLDDAPILGEYIKAFLTEKSNEGFFFNRDYLTSYMEAAETKRKELPGQGYFKLIIDFYTNHYNTGELFMEYLKKDCINKTGKPCDFCSKHNWVGPTQERIPQPVPDPPNPFHYMKPFETPKDSRFPDDWQPRANIKKEFENGTLESQGDIECFANKFAVEISLVQDYIKHLKDLKHRSEM